MTPAAASAAVAFHFNDSVLQIYAGDGGNVGCHRPVVVLTLLSVFVLLVRMLEIDANANVRPRATSFGIFHHLLQSTGTLPPPLLLRFFLLRRSRSRDNLRPLRRSHGPTGMSKAASLSGAVRLA